MAELVDAPDLGSGFYEVKVQVLLSASKLVSMIGTGALLLVPIVLGGFLQLEMGDQRIAHRIHRHRLLIRPDLQRRRALLHQHF